jgi:N-acetylglucosamine-6-phosphate deacetylase
LKLVEEDLWVSSGTGKILNSQHAFYSNHTVPDRVIDCKGRIISPGLIDLQLNGAFGMNFSIVPAEEEGGMTRFAKRLREVNRKVVETGVTSYLPTVTSQKAEVYHQILPHLGPSGCQRNPHDGSESLGAHVEGPFLNPTKNGIHTREVLISAASLADIEACYGEANLDPSNPRIKMITVAPEQGKMTALIPELVDRDMVVSIGHSEATYEQAHAAVAAGAGMITHLFNAMRPLHHRNPGIFGVLGTKSIPAAPKPNLNSSVRSVRGQGHGHGHGRETTDRRPSFGIIADGIHLHPTSVKIAWHAFPEGMVLVTDAMHLVGCPDGVYEWTMPASPSPSRAPSRPPSDAGHASDPDTSAITNGTACAGADAAASQSPAASMGAAPSLILKRGPLLTLYGVEPQKIAGSSITLIECVNNFWNWSGCSIPQALSAVTAAPARVVGLEGTKGGLAEGMDADLVVLGERVRRGGATSGDGDGEGNGEEWRELVVEEVWKFGERVV